MKRRKILLIVTVSLVVFCVGIFISPLFFMDNLEKNGYFGSWFCSEVGGNDNISPYSGFGSAAEYRFANATYKYSELPNGDDVSWGESQGSYKAKSVGEAKNGVGNFEISLENGDVLNFDIERKKHKTPDEEVTGAVAKVSNSNHKGVRYCVGFIR